MTKYRFVNQWEESKGLDIGWRLEEIPQMTLSNGVMNKLGRKFDELFDKHIGPLENLTEKKRQAFRTAWEQYLRDVGVNETDYEITLEERIIKTRSDT